MQLVHAPESPGLGLLTSSTAQTPRWNTLRPFLQQHKASEFVGCCHTLASRLDSRHLSASESACGVLHGETMHSKQRPTPQECKLLGAQGLHQSSSYQVTSQCEPQSKLLVSPKVTFPYIVPYVIHLFRILDCSSCFFSVGHSKAWRMDDAAHRHRRTSAPLQPLFT